MAVPKEASTLPWVGLGAAVWVQIAAGNSYTFPLYSHTLKSVLGYNQQQITMLGVANDVGENMGLLPGILCNRLPPWLILMIGTMACFVGYGLLWLAVSETIGSLPYWLLWIALCIATNSSAWFCTSVLVTNMKNFPLSRGTVTGILKGYMGLSAAVYTEIYSGVLDSSSEKLLLFLCLGIPIVCLALMYFIKPCMPDLGENSEVQRQFIFTQVASVVLAVYLLATTLLDDVLSLNSAFSISFVGLMVIFLLAPLAIPLKMTLYSSSTKEGIGLDLAGSLKEPLVLDKEEQGTENPESEHSAEGMSDNGESLVHVSPSSRYLGNFPKEDTLDVYIDLANGEGAAKKKRRPKRGEDFKFLEAFIKADFWLLFWVYFLGVGSGVTVLNNLAQIGIAEGVSDTTMLLSLFSFCNFIGRLGGGAVSEYYVRLKSIPRTIWMAITQIIMIGAYLMFCYTHNVTLYAATALLGICYGVQFSIMVPTASELFGLKHFGIIYNFMCMGNPLSAFLFSGLLAGYVYDKEVERQQGGNYYLGATSSTCLGPNCFRLTFLVLAGVCGLGSLLSIILTIRIRPVYQMLYSED